ncbi:MAG: efflux transporter outer membrane subunit [Prevotella sp.]|nr:efflux transporter outer membrane subunit [Candidatus Prevotella equi]
MMKKLTIMTIMSATVLMSSCGLYSKYQRPEVSAESIDNIMRDADQYANTTDSSSFGDVAWREVFTDPQLQTLIEKGLDNNVDVYAAAVNVEKLTEALKCARLAFLPSVNFGSQQPMGTISNIFAGRDHNPNWTKSYSIPISASWTVDIFGKILAAKRGAEANLSMMKDYQQAARSGIICGVANCYYTLLMLDRQMELLKEMEKLTKDTWEMMKLQKELRGARETSVVSAEAAYLGVKSSIIEMNRQILATESALSLLIGQPAQHIARGTLAAQYLPEKFSTGYPIRLLNIRPDVHAAEMKLASCFYDVTSARASMYPQLTITASASYVTPGDFIAAFAGSLMQPLFQNGRLRYQLKAAKLDYDVAAKEWEHTILSAGAEVSNALIEYNSAKEKSAVDANRVEVLEKSVEYTRNLFSMGSSSYLEVISAQSNLLNAQTNQVTDDFNKMQAVVNLYSALGGGRY